MQEINVEWVQFFLGEAIEELDTLRTGLASPDFDGMSFGPTIGMALGHVNAAWNGRHIPAAPGEIDRLSDGEWRSLRSNSTDLDPSMSG